MSIMILGFALCVVPVLVCRNKEESYSYFMLNLISSIVFLVLGMVLSISSFLNVEFFSFLGLDDPTPMSNAMLSFLFGGVSLFLIILSNEPEREYYPFKLSGGKGLYLLIGLGVVTFILVGMLWLLQDKVSDFPEIYFTIIQNPVFITVMLGAIGIVLMLILGGPLSLTSKAERECRGQYLIVEKSRKSGVFLFLFLLALVVAGIIGYYVRDTNVIVLGQVGDSDDFIAETSDMLGLLYWSIMSEPSFIITVVLVLIGGLAKTISANKAANQVSNVLILWLPAFFWVLVIIRFLPTPDIIIDAFSGIEFIAYLMYMLIYGVLMMGIAGIVTVFQGFKSLGGA